MLWLGLYSMSSNLQQKRKLIFDSRSQGEINLELLETTSGEDDRDVEELEQEYFKP